MSSKQQPMLRNLPVIAQSKLHARSVAASHVASLLMASSKLMSTSQLKQQVLSVTMPITATTLRSPARTRLMAITTIKAMLSANLNHATTSVSVATTASVILMLVDRAASEAVKHQQKISSQLQHYLL